MQRLVERRDQDKYEVGENLRIRREELGMSQDQLADIVGTSRQAVSRYENGESEIKITTFIQYADALEAEPQELFPERFRERKKPSEKLELLINIACGLPDGDIAILIAMAARMKQ